MNDIQEEAPLDPAQAFTAMRHELALLGAGIKGLIADPPQVHIPDYSETLEELRSDTYSLAKSYKAMRASPLLDTTPERLAAQIKAASAEARRAEQNSLASAEEELRAVAKELAGFAESARTADRQNKWNLAMLAFGVALGVTLCWLFGQL